MRNLDSKVRKLDTDGLKQQEILYNQVCTMRRDCIKLYSTPDSVQCLIADVLFRQDFGIQQLERRINRMQGESNNDELEEYERRIQQLTQELADRQNMAHMLLGQIKHLAVSETSTVCLCKRVACL